MPNALHVLFGPLGPDAIAATLASAPASLAAGDPFAYFLLIAFLRYQVPDFVLGVVNLVRPSALRTPATWPSGERYPLVSVIVAGRNPGAAIRTTIHSAMNNGYPNVEVIYADDDSSDDSVLHARALERYGRVKIFANPNHSGKPTNLNIACRLARGRFLFVLDADAELEYGTIEKLVAYFANPVVGGVCANMKVRNARANLLTRLQEVEFAMNTLARLWRGKLGLLNILPGAAAMFRIEALQRIGFYDTGLGDDTDVTMRLRKARWRIESAPEAWIYTDCPVTLGHLYRQRIRWARNMVKVRLRKQLDLGHPRYGWSNTLVSLDHILFRVVFPLWGTYAILSSLVFRFGDRPEIVTSLYWFVTFLMFCKMLVANDIDRSPPLRSLWLALLFIPYRTPLRVAESLAIVRELLRIRTWHPYVPKHIWSQSPHH